MLLMLLEEEAPRLGQAGPVLGQVRGQRGHGEARRGHVVGLQGSARVVLLQVLELQLVGRLGQHREPSVGLPPAAEGVRNGGGGELGVQGLRVVHERRELGLAL